MTDPVPYAVIGSGLNPNHSLTAYSEIGIAEVATHLMVSTRLVTTFYQS